MTISHHGDHNLLVCRVFFLGVRVSDITERAASPETGVGASLCQIYGQRNHTWVSENDIAS